MAELRTIARPYAKAAFGLARDAGRLGEWSRVLAAAAAVTQVEEFRGLLGHPAVAPRVLAGILATTTGVTEDSVEGHFLRILVERRRARLLPAIHALYEALRAEAEHRTVVELVSAVELDDAQRRRFAAALEARLGTEVEITTGTDPSIIGGAIIRAGDMVIDGSVRGRLEKLAATLAR